jgi:hypothetical protein
MIIPRTRFSLCVDGTPKSVGLLGWPRDAAS